MLFVPSFAYMQRRAQHTYALPSGRGGRASPAATNSPSSASSPEPRSPSQPSSPKRPGILLPAAQHYSSLPSSPLARTRGRHSRQSSTSTGPLTPPPVEPNVDVWQFVSSESKGYVANDWSLLAIQRPRPKAKYIVSLLHWPSMSIYAWPIEIGRTLHHNKCYVTSIGTSKNSEDAGRTVLSASIRVLTDVIQTWVRYSRKNPSRFLNGSIGRQQTDNRDVDSVTASLHLARTTDDQRQDWLERQQVPAELPLSGTSSPMSTPPALEANQSSYFSPQELENQLRRMEVSPTQALSSSPYLSANTAMPRQRLPSSVSPADRNISPIARDPNRQVPAVSITGAPRSDSPSAAVAVTTDDPAGHSIGGSAPRKYSITELPPSAADPA